MNINQMLIMLEEAPVIRGVCVLICFDFHFRKKNHPNQTSNQNNIPFNLDYFGLILNITLFSNQTNFKWSSLNLFGSLLTFFLVLRHF